MIIFANTENLHVKNHQGVEKDEADVEADGFKIQQLPLLNVLNQLKLGVWVEV